MQEIEIRVRPEEFNEVSLKELVASHSHIPSDSINNVFLVKKSIDARKSPVWLVLRIQVFTENETGTDPFDFTPQYKNVTTSPEVHIIGFGPAGMFAALSCLEQGYKPVVFERGKKIKDRRRDLVEITREHQVNPDSNYCFGEGGAGTFSDGKLYTRSKKRGPVLNILQKLVYHGAPRDILVDAHPHIGTNKLPAIIEHIRETILAHGGEIHFKSKLTDVVYDHGGVSSIRINNENIKVKNLILATGHSARDIFTLLHDKDILIEFKPFALGVRIEHPQEIIDRAQYHCSARPPALPPARYTLNSKLKDKSVYSFCMCPGGIIAPCATNPGEIVTNGWSPSKRNNPFANSGMVVNIDESDVKKLNGRGALKGMYLQSAIEQLAFEIPGSAQKGQIAPAQRLTDFLSKKQSQDLPACSYIPGVAASNLHELLPHNVSQALMAGFREFGKKMKGYMTAEAVVVGPESRTSSPVRIPRDNDSLCHPQVKGFYPCGEGAGYAGGIVSAAIDGQKCVSAIAGIYKTR